MIILPYPASNNRPERGPIAKDEASWKLPIQLKNDSRHQRILVWENNCTKYCWDHDQPKRFAYNSLSIIPSISMSEQMIWVTFIDAERIKITVCYLERLSRVKLITYPIAVNRTNQL